jgi:hypothetical protein
MSDDAGSGAENSVEDGVKDEATTDPAPLPATPEDAYDVPEDQQLDVDGGPGSDATDGGDDTEGLSVIYDDPGEVVDEEHLQ